MFRNGLSFEDQKGPIIELGNANFSDKNGISWPQIDALPTF
jgi:hypothetical protein